MSYILLNNSMELTIRILKKKKNPEIIKDILDFSSFYNRCRADLQFYFFFRLKEGMKECVYTSCLSNGEIYCFMTAFPSERSSCRLLH